MFTRFTFTAKKQIKILKKVTHKRAFWWHKYKLVQVGGVHQYEKTEVQCFITCRHKFVSG